MGLHFHPDAIRVLDDWHKQRNPSRSDRDLVSDVLATVADGQGQWSRRWDHYTDETEDDVTIIEPRPGLMIYVRLWDGDDTSQLTLVRIADTGPPEHPDMPRHC